LAVKGDSELNAARRPVPPARAPDRAMHASSPAWLEAGCWVRITGLAKAPQHNGKVGKVSSKAAQEQGRVGVELGKGQTLSVRLQNLERAEEPEPSAVDAPMPAAPEGVQRTLQRDNAVLQEFDGSGDPNTLVLYHHLRDRAFDAFNAAEYNEQMLRYYAGGITVSEVVPRKMGDNDYLLVCLRNKVAVVAAAAAAGVAVGGWVGGWVGGGGGGGGGGGSGGGDRSSRYHATLLLLRSRTTTLCASSPSSACDSSAASRCCSSVAASRATGE